MIPIDKDKSAKLEQSLEAARLAIAWEAHVVESLVSRVDESFAEAVDLIYGASGRLAITGLGKSGRVGSRAAATFASTGTPAFFVHASESLHGDAGMVQPEDIVLAISNSGESPEVCALVHILKERGAKVISMTGGMDSTLARLADVKLNISVSREADPLNLVPTASIVATSAMCDALAVALMVMGEFTSEDFALNHPAGALGNRLVGEIRAGTERQ